ncbi:hypothetical protein DFJ73DRAFT_758277 [Zopfochytrium polystomum]|nr:hypothetical protein DFJ73DRAFT_758277 [Zopfochytrium polystomum]
MPEVWNDLRNDFLDAKATEIEVEKFPQQDIQKAIHIPLKNCFDLTGRHLLTFFEDMSHLACKRLMRKVLKLECKFVGLDPSAWQRVTDSADGETLLPKAWWKCDAMDVEQLRLAFSEKVENKLRQLGFVKEAEFASVIRGFYDAFDTRGLSDDDCMAKCQLIIDYFMSKLG